MKKSLILLEQYRKKMAWIVAIIITLLIVVGIFSVGVLMGKNFQDFETEKVDVKIERLKNIAEMRDMVSPDFRDTFDQIVIQVLENVRIIQNEKVLFDAIQKPNIPTIPEGQTLVIDDFRYKAKTVQTSKNTFYILARVEAQSDKYWLAWLFVYTLVATICILPFALFLSFHLVNIFFRPLHLMVENLEDFTGNINHEFKTSLAEVISSLELAEITQNYQKGTRQAIASSRRMNMILDSLGHTVHLVNSDYRKETVDLIAIFENALREFFPEIENKNLILLRKYSQKQKSPKFIDHEPLVLVFRNIVKNAIRYSKNGGKIEIEICKKYFRVTDYGVGIASENLDKIFGRYFREDYSGKGSGIGLALAKKIVDRYEWDLKIASQKGEFTEVTVYFEKGNN